MLQDVCFYEVPKGKLRSYRVQKHTSLSDEQLSFIKDNHGKMGVAAISKMLGLTYGKVHKNIVVMGLVKKRQNKKAKVVNIANGMFNEKEFFKEYKY